MLALALMILVGATDMSPAGIVQIADASPSNASAESGPRETIRDAMTQKLKAMSDADQAVVHEDVTPLVTPYFHEGQSFAETERVLAAQKLGPLRHFHGTGERADNPIYVSHTDLSDEMFSDVAIVLDFEFAGSATADMTLRKVRAFLQSSSI